MKTVTVTTISTLRNAGQRAEQNLAYTLLGKFRDPGNLPFDKGSDIPEYDLFVKSARFTLVSGNLMTATTLEGQINEYMARTASKMFAYVSNENVAYMMSATEFKAFLMAFARFEKDSTKNGGCYKVRFPKETRKVLEWLAQRV